MKVFCAVGFLALASSICGAVAATPSDYSDVIVVSVVPRSPSVQPFVMGIPAKEQPKQVDTLKLRAVDAKR